ncbi:MAG: carboxypeptidase-like regulatory domain-containing protein, partial [Myxococcota bacterium]|nr:carboxypeptidase-like regulatory domain-containing protein [Myxococcota bacterium]
LTATHGDFGPVTSAPITLDGKHARSGVELVLAAGGIVRGVVHDKAGKPVASADVRVVAKGHVEWRARRQAFTDADGKFVIAGLARRAAEVVARHDSGASAIAPADLAAKREHDVVLVLDVDGAIAGTVVDPKGAPIGDAQVIAEPEWSGGVADRAAWSVRGVQETVTDQGGAFRFAGLPAGSYRIRAARPGASEAALSLAAGIVAQPNGAPVKLVVPADGRVIGKVAFADGKAPAAFHLTLGWTHPTPFAAKDGAFALPAPGGTHMLTISGLGFVEQRREVAISDGKDTDVGTITVAAGRSISGRVLDDTGAPVAKAKVAAGMLLTGGGEELYIKDESIGAKDTETDAGGHFTLDGFPPAAVTVVAGKDGIGRSASIRIPGTTDSATLDLVLAPTTGLAGKITRGGAPLADTIVIANPIGATASNFFVATGPDGTFALDALAPGAYVVFPMLGGGGGRPKDMYMRKVEVMLGKRAHVDIDTTLGPITLAINIKTDRGTSVPMAQVLAIQATLDPHSLEELRDGSHMPFGEAVIPIYIRGAMGGATEIQGVRAGPHTICAMLGDPRADPASLKFKCTPAKLGAAAKQSVTVVVPAAWIEAK